MNTDSENLALASDPSTPAETLAALAEVPDVAVRQALAANPNTPEELLHLLWEDHPAGLLENPILALWEFSRAGSIPDLIGDRLLLCLFNHLRSSGAELPAHLFTADSLCEMVRSALSRQDPSIFAFVPFEERTSLRISLLDSPSRRMLFEFFEEHAPDAVWMRFATDPSPVVREAFADLLRSATSGNTPPRPIVAEAARLLFQDGRSDLLVTLANCRILPGDLIELLADSPVAEVREPLTRCIFAGVSTLKRLAADPAIPVRLSLARNCELEEIHQILVRDPAPEVRGQLAKNKSLSRGILELFDSHDLPEVLHAVFLARQADSRLRVRLLREGRAEIQGAVLKLGAAYTQAFHREVACLLAVETRACLAECTRLPRVIVEELARDPESRVRLGVARRLGNCFNRGSSPANLALLKLLAADPLSSIRLQVCSDPRLDKESTAALFNDRDPVIQKKCVQSVLGEFESLLTTRKFETYETLYKGKAALLTAMAHNPDHLVRLALAEARETPPSAKGILMHDPEPFIREACLKQSHWPYGVLLDLENRLGANAASRALRHGATTPSSSALRALSESPNPFERLLTARCRRTPKASLQHLALDPHPPIREAAMAQLQKK
jgi:hypothetical protein